MNSYDCYVLYLALKIHFSKWEYDYFHFRGKVNTNPTTFKRRKDRQWFEKVARHHSPFEKILSHFTITNNPYIRDIATKDDIYLDWQARVDNLSGVFTEEIKRLKSVFHENFLFKPGMHPYMIREYLGGRISLETLTIISDLTDCVSYWGSNVEDDPIFEEVVMRIVKYSPFLDYDTKKFKKILGSRVDVAS